MTKIAFKHYQDRAQRGDTIIEVLIAIAIVSLVLTSAYALTNRNVLGIQDAQEQTYAQKLVQQQVELLGEYSQQATGVGCFNTSTSPATYKTPQSDPVCNNVTNGGAVYKLVITPPSSPSKTYSVVATWPTASGSNANVTVYYRVVVAP